MGQGRASSCTRCLNVVYVSHVSFFLPPSRAQSTQVALAPCSLAKLLLHRPSLFLAAAFFSPAQNGRVVESGKHGELLSLGEISFFLLPYVSCSCFKVSLLSDRFSQIFLSIKAGTREPSALMLLLGLTAVRESSASDASDVRLARPSS